MIRPRTALTRLASNALVLVWFETAVRFEMALIVLPVALASLEGIELSIWLLFNALMALALLADSGLSPTLLRAAAYFHNGAEELPLSFNSQCNRNELSTESTDPNWETLQSLVATSGRMYGFVAVASVLLLGICGSASVWNLMEMSGHNSKFWLAFTILVMWACLQVQIVRWSGILQGLGRVAQAKRIDATASTLKIVFFSIVLLLGYGVLGYACAGLVIVTLNLFLMRRAVIAFFPTGKQGKIHAYDQRLFLRIWPATWRLGLINLGAYLVFHGGSLVIAQLQDPVVILSSLLTLRVIGVIRQIAQAPLTAYLPKVVGSLARIDLEAYRALTTRIMVIALSTFLFASAALLLAGDRVLMLLGVNTFLLPASLVLAFLFTSFMEIHLSIHSTLYIATNHVPFVYLAIVTGTLMTLLGYLLLDSYGLWGIILARIVVQSLCNYWYPVYLSLGLSNWRFREYLRALVTECLSLCARLVNLRRKEGFA